MSSLIIKIDILKRQAILGRCLSLVYQISIRPFHRHPGRFAR